MECGRQANNRDKGSAAKDRQGGTKKVRVRVGDPRYAGITERAQRGGEARSS